MVTVCVYCLFSCAQTSSGLSGAGGSGGVPGLGGQTELHQIQPTPCEDVHSKEE